MRINKFITLSILAIFIVSIMLINCGGGESTKEERLASLKTPPKGNLSEAKVAEYLYSAFPKGKKYKAVVAGFTNPITMTVDDPAKTFSNQLYGKLADQKIKPANLTLATNEELREIMSKSSKDEAGTFVSSTSLDKLVDKYKVNMLITGYVVKSANYYSIFMVDLETYEVISAYSTYRDDSLHEIAKKVIAKNKEKQKVGIIYLASNYDDKDKDSGSDEMAQPGHDPLTEAWPFSKELSVYIAQIRPNENTPKIVWTWKMTDVRKSLGIKSKTMLKEKEVKDQNKKKYQDKAKDFTTIYYGNYAPDSKKITLKFVDIANPALSDLGEATLKKSHPVQSAYEAYNLANQAKSKLDGDKLTKDDMNEIKNLIDEALQKDSMSSNAYQAKILYLLRIKNSAEAKTTAQKYISNAESLGDTSEVKIGNYYLAWVLYNEDKDKNERIEIKIKESEIKSGMKGIFDNYLRVMEMKKNTIKFDGGFKLSEDTTKALAEAAKISGDANLSKALWATITLANYYFDNASYTSAAQYYDSYKNKVTSNNLEKGVAGYRIGLGNFLEGLSFAAQLAEQVYEDELEKDENEVNVIGNEISSFYAKMIQDPMEKAINAMLNASDIIRKNASNDKNGVNYYDDCQLSIADWYLFMSRYYLLMQDNNNAMTNITEAIKTANKIQNSATKSYTLSYLEDFKKQVPTWWADNAPKKSKKKK